MRRARRSDDACPREESASTRARALAIRQCFARRRHTRWARSSSPRLAARGCAAACPKRRNVAARLHLGAPRGARPRRAARRRSGIASIARRTARCRARGRDATTTRAFRCRAARLPQVLGGGVRRVARIAALARRRRPVVGRRRSADRGGFTRGSAVAASRAVCAAERRRRRRRRGGAARKDERRGRRAAAALAPARGARRAEPRRPRRPRTTIEQRAPLDRRVLGVVAEGGGEEGVGLVEVAALDVEVRHREDGGGAERFVHLLELRRLGARRRAARRAPPSRGRREDARRRRRRRRRRRVIRRRGGGRRGGRGRRRGGAPSGLRGVGRRRRRARRCARGALQHQHRRATRARR